MALTPTSTFAPTPTLSQSHPYSPTESRESPQDARPLQALDDLAAPVGSYHNQGKFAGACGKDPGRSASVRSLCLCASVVRKTAGFGLGRQQSGIGRSPGAHGKAQDVAPLCVLCALCVSVVSVRKPSAPAQCSHAYCAAWLPERCARSPPGLQTISAVASELPVVKLPVDVLLASPGPSWRWTAPRSWPAWRRWLET